MPLYIFFSESFQPLKLWVTFKYTHLLSSGGPDGIMNIWAIVKIINNSCSLIQENIFRVCVQ